MKKIICAITIFLALTSTATFAQIIPLDYLASELTREMSVNLRINDADFMKLRNMNLALLTQETEITEKYKSDFSLQNDKLIEVRNDYETKLRTILNAKQMEAFADFKTKNSPNDSQGTEASLTANKMDQP